MIAEEGLKIAKDCVYEMCMNKIDEVDFHTTDLKEGVKNAEEFFVLLSKSDDDTIINYLLRKFWLRKDDYSGFRVESSTLYYSSHSHNENYKSKLGDEQYKNLWNKLIGKFYEQYIYIIGDAAKLYVKNIETAKKFLMRQNVKPKTKEEVQRMIRKLCLKFKEESEESDDDMVQTIYEDRIKVLKWVLGDEQYKNFDITEVD